MSLRGNPEDMGNDERDDQDFTEEAADALDEPRRAAGDEEKTLEEQPGALTTDDPEKGDVSAF